MFSAVTRRWSSNFLVLHWMATGSRPSSSQAESVRSRSWSGVSSVKATKTSSTKQSLRAQELLEIGHAHLAAHHVLLDARALGIHGSPTASAKRRVGLFLVLLVFHGLDGLSRKAVAPGQVHGAHVHGVTLVAQANHFLRERVGGSNVARREVRVHVDKRSRKGLLLKIGDRLRHFL